MKCAPDTELEHSSKDYFLSLQRRWLMAEMIFPHHWWRPVLQSLTICKVRLTSAGSCEDVSDVAVRQGHVEAMSGGAALFFSGSAGQSLSQLSDFHQQLPLAAVQLGSASIQRNWRSKIIFVKKKKKRKLLSAKLCLIVLDVLNSVYIITDYSPWSTLDSWLHHNSAEVSENKLTHRRSTCWLKVNCCSGKSCGFPSLSG